MINTTAKGAKNYLDRKRRFKDKAIDACDKFNGLAEIGNNYFIVDTTKYEVRERNE